MRTDIETWTFQIWSTQAAVLTTGPALDATLRNDVGALLVDIEIAISRFRADSEVSRIAQRPGVAMLVSPRFTALAGEAEQMRELTRGAVDVNVGAQIRDLGYDRYWAATAGVAPVATRATPWARTGLDRRIGTFTGQPGRILDFGSIGKAYAAREVATLIESRVGRGVLVNLGGDIAIAGEPPTGGWMIAIDDEIGAGGQVVALHSGGLATSSAVRRVWVDESGAARHHIVDPRTGVNPPPFWATATVVAGDVVRANALATAAIVLGPAASELLDARFATARLVHLDGGISYAGGWPVDEIAEAS